MSVKSESEQSEWRLASADFTFPLLSHEKVLDLISALELDGIDIGLFEGRSHLWPSREFKQVSQSAKALRDKLIDRGLAPADVFLQLDPDFIPYAINQPDAERRQHARDEFLRTLEYAGELGSPHVTTLPGVYFEAEESAADSWQRSQDELAWRVEQAKSHEINFSVEAHVGSLAPNPPEAERMVRGVPGLTLTLDYTHFTRIGLADAEIEPLVQFASHFHVRGARKDRLQTSFKNNTIDYARVLQAMRACGYKGYLGNEDV
jgi:sugar phosphate isomerase/epimerase